MTETIDLDDLLAAATAATGTRPAIRDVGILEAALARPMASAYGAEIYTDLHAKAGALLHSLVTGHALVDGNKRLGWAACRLFYRMNGQDLRMPADAWYELVVSIADGSLRDVSEIAARLTPFVATLTA